MKQSKSEIFPYIYCCKLLTYLQLQPELRSQPTSYHWLSQIPEEKSNDIICK